MKRHFVFFIVMLAGCTGTPLALPPPLIPSGKHAPLLWQPELASALGQSFKYRFTLDNQTNGVHADGTTTSQIVPYSDTKINTTIAAVSTSSATRTQYGLPIEPFLSSATTVYALDSTGYPSLVIAKSKQPGMKYVTSPQGGYPFIPLGGVFRVGDAYSSGLASFNDGSTSQESAIIVRTEFVDVPAGRFEAFRIEGTISTQGGGEAANVGETIEWRNDQIGTVKLESKFQTGNGFILITLELIDTNIQFVVAP